MYNSPLFQQPIIHPFVKLFLKAEASGAHSFFLITGCLAIAAAIRSEQQGMKQNVSI
jgi:hypothetical protein